MNKPALFLELLIDAIGSPLHSETKAVNQTNQQMTDDYFNLN
ncbi:hypothetical protein [Coleofasciculus chthonoplastes]